jgi:hypothetical protein
VPKPLASAILRPMEQEAWPTPQEPSREPLPRVEDLPVAEQGYEQESVKAAFDSFYRHAAQLDAALRTLEAVDSFHRHAGALRADLRALRSAGWTQQSWTAPPSYGYGLRAPREGISPAVWRIAGEVGFLVAVAVTLGVAKLSWWAILLAMAGAFAIVCVIEWLAGREPLTFARAAPTASVHPVVEAQRAEDTEEQESFGWTAFEEAQEPSDAMTIIGAPPREADGEEPAAAEEEQVLAEAAPEPEQEPEAEPEQEPEAEPEEAEAEPEPEAEAESEPEPEPDEPEDPELDLPPAAELEEEPEAEPEPDGRRRWWRRRSDASQSLAAEVDEPDLPRHVRVLPMDERSEVSDPWEDGFNEPIAAEADELAEIGEPEEETEDPILLRDTARRRFRRR